MGIDFHYIHARFDSCAGCAAEYLTGDSADNHIAECAADFNHAVIDGDRGDVAVSHAGD